MENIIEEANRCLNCKVKPCSKACPLGNDIPTFIKAVKENDLEEAFNVLTQTTVLGAICGRVCPHQKQCMGSCVRGIKSNPINIGELETYVFDNALEKDLKINKTEELKGKKVAVIGGGPSGLTCAAFLSMNGANVTIYEKQPKLGGITRYGIPDFRLPREVIDKTVEKILSLGIEAKCNQELGKDYELDEIADKYDAVYLSFGANVSSRMNIPGEDLDGVYGENELLKTVEEATSNLVKMRETEGNRISKDLLNRISKIQQKVIKISSLSTGLIEEYVVKLEGRIKDLIKDKEIDESRLAQEVVIYADKCSIEEEVTRLNSHIFQFEKQIKDSQDAIGKKLDFMIQEMNRETNTIGSKANNLEITNGVIDIKTELENIREQVQNIE